MTRSRIETDCAITTAELTAYADRELNVERLAFLDHHVRKCSSCQQRLNNQEMIGILINAAAPQIDSSEIGARKAALMERLRQPDVDNRPRRSFALGGWRPVLATIIAVAFLSVVAVPRNTWADFPLSRIVDFTRISRLTPSGPSVIQEQHRSPTTPTTTQSDVTAPDNDMLIFDPVILSTLPDGSMLVSTTVASPQRVELAYNRADGLEITITEIAASDSQMAIEREYYELEQLEGVDVLMLPNPDFSAISHLVWEHEGILFSVLVGEETAGIHVTRTDARALVTGLIHMREQRD